MLLADYGADVVKLEPREDREFRAPGLSRDPYFFLSSNRASARSPATCARRAAASSCWPVSRA